MKTKIIPFDAKMAKKIQVGEIEGKIKTRDLKTTMNIVCYDSTTRYCDILQPIIAQDIENCTALYAYSKDGAYDDEEENPKDLVLEVLDDEPQFKPFDKVLMRSPSFGYVCWYPHFYCRYIPNDKRPYVSLEGFGYEQCIPYEGNEHLVGTTNKPKED